MARKKCKGPRRERIKLDEQHGYEHVETFARDLVQRQVDEDFAAREDEDDETSAGFAAWGGMAA